MSLHWENSFITFGWICFWIYFYPKWMILQIGGSSWISKKTGAFSNPENSEKCTKIFIYNNVLQVIQKYNLEHLTWHLGETSARSVFSAPLEHLVEVGQVGDLQHAPVLAEALGRREEAAERLEHGVLHLPAPRARLAVRLQTTRTHVTVWSTTNDPPNSVSPVALDRRTQGVELGPVWIVKKSFPSYFTFTPVVRSRKDDGKEDSFNSRT